MSNTFVQGTVPGSLNSSSEIKLLLTYLIREYDKQISRNLLINCLCDAEVANYFEIASALGNLIESGHITIADDEYLYASPLSDALVPLFDDLPISIIEKSKICIDTALGAQNSDSGMYARIIKTESGFLIKCRLTEKETLLFENTVFAPGMEEAQLIKSKMLQNMEQIYLYTTSFFHE